MRNRKLSNETDDADGESSNDEGRSLLDMVGPEGNDDRCDHAHNIDRYRHQLRVGRGVAHLLNDTMENPLARHPEEKIKRTYVGTVAVNPYVPILQAQNGNTAIQILQSLNPSRIYDQRILSTFVTRP